MTKTAAPPRKRSKPAQADPLDLRAQILANLGSPRPLTQPAWLRPSYPLREKAESPEPGNGTLPLELRSELAQALAERHTRRPLESVIPLVQGYVRWRRYLEEAWTWTPELDGRDLAFLIFETHPGELPDWSASQARRFTQLADRLYALASVSPEAPLPPWRPDGPAQDLPQLLWRHYDRFALALQLGLFGLELLPCPPFPRGTSREARQKTTLLMEMHVVLMHFLDDFPDMSLSEQREAAEASSLSFYTFECLFQELLGMGNDELIEGDPRDLYPLNPALLKSIEQERSPKPPRKGRRPKA